MVWAMNLPSSFGDYWPEGSYESDPQQPLSDGWGDRLKKYFFSQTKQVQKEIFDYRGEENLATHSYPYFVSSKFITEIGGFIGPDYPPVSAIKLHEPPRYFHTLRSYKSLASLIKLNDRIIAVDETLKSIIEQLEPEIHQFFPIEIRMRRGQVYPVSYYIFVIGRYFDGFLPEDSDPGSFRANGPVNFFHEETKKGISGLALSRSVFKNSHLWRERCMSFLPIFFSDELQERISIENLRIPKHWKMRELRNYGDSGITVTELR